MMKIEKNMYVRTDKGIAKYLGLGIDVLKDDGSNSYNHWKSKHIFDNYIFDEEYGDTLATLDNIDKIIIRKPSFNIIDLIEVGDILHSKYDNEWWTVQKHQGPKEPLWIQLEWQVIESEKDFFKQIDGIITKEQAESVSYKVSE